MKTIHSLKMQKVGMFLDLAMRRLNGEISREEHQIKCNKIHLAYARVFDQIITKHIK